ncbi:MAG: HAMP domain-containing sensor histidine kinase [Xanthobacteraceae bacterium]
MRRADILAGSAFKAAVRAVVIMAVAFAAAGGLAYYTVRHAMYSELERQLVEEILLFDEVYRTGGQAALVAAVRKLESPEIVGRRYVALIDANGAKLVGNLNVAPAYLKLTRKIEIVPTREGNTVAARGKAFDTLQLVVGRSTEIIDVTLRTLIYVLVAAFLLILIGVLLAGWVLSKQSLEKLARISETLERVGRGDTTARIGAMSGDGQIDRIASMIDLSLGRLSALTESSQNTIRAIAHDLRTPLNRTLIRIESAATAPEGERDGLLADAEEELHKLAAVFDTVLRISTLETSFDRDAFRDVDVATVISDSVPLFESDFAEKRQQIEVFAGDPVIVRGDGQALRQLLVNLLANANLHTAEGTRITVSARREDDSAVLEVCDNGKGIEENQHEAVLKPFTRLDASRSVAGSGLGLALVNAIAIRHGASVELADNKPGLCVRVRFPD